MQTKFQEDRSKPINIAVAFDKNEVAHYDREKMREYAENRLEKHDIMYVSVVALDMESGAYTLQCKLNKAAINIDTIMKLDEAFGAMDGYIDMWILTESALYHPEIYK